MKHKPNLRIVYGPFKAPHSPWRDRLVVTLIFFAFCLLVLGYLAWRAL